jgi:hypothetical protein
MLTLLRVQTLAMVANVGFAVPRKEVVLMGYYGPSQRFGGEGQATPLLILSAGVE